MVEVKAMFPSARVFGSLLEGPPGEDPFFSFEKIVDVWDLDPEDQNPQMLLD